jgi:flavorubredoxin
MSKVTIAPDIYYVGVRDWDRPVFDALIPLPLGTSYNSYIVKGSEKTALIDTVEPCKAEEFFIKIKNCGITRLDYIVANHAEQDHSGLIEEVLKLYPEAMIVTNAKCKDLLKAFLLLPEDKFIEVKDGETLSLGNKTLEFVLAPWVHWPDTMFAFVKEDNVLFSTDFFGAHLADSSVFVDNDYRVIDAAKRYYAQIMMPFRSSVVTNLKKIERLDIKIIAPSHGQVYNNPELIMDAYKLWSSETVRNEVIIPYVTMHGSTQKMVDYLVEALVERGIKVRPFNLDICDLGEFAMSLVDAATIIIASPAVLVGAHPKVVYGAYLINSLRPKTKYVGIIGSFGWGSKMVENITGLISNLKVEMLEPVIIKGFPTEKDYDSLNSLAENINEKHIESNLI